MASLRTLLWTVLCLLGLTSVARATDWNVYPGQSIQLAINASQNGDRVLVHPGTYLGGLVFGGKSVTVVSTGGPEVTTLEGSYLSVPCIRFTAGEPMTATVDGFTIRGSAVIPSGQGNAVRVANSSGTLRNCKLVHTAGINSANYIVMYSGALTVESSSFIGLRSNCAEGGVFYMSGTSVLTIRGSLFDQCESGTGCGYGGGVIRSTDTASILVEDSSFDRCVSRNGGPGGVLYSTGSLNLTVRRTEFLGCRAESSSGGVIYNSCTSSTFVLEDVKFIGCGASGNGGALYCGGTFDCTMDRCEFASCSAGSGGAVYFEYPRNLSISQTSFTGNISSSAGGAMRFYYPGATGYCPSLAVRDCRFEQNSSSGSTAGDIYNDNNYCGSTVVLERNYHGFASASNEATTMRWAMPVSMVDCVVNRSVGNTNWDVALNGGGTVRNCTFYGGGRYPLRYANSVENCIIRGWYTCDGNPNYQGSFPNYSNIQDPCGYGYQSYGNGNITSDPLFRDPTTGDFTLLPGSSCRDAGNPNSYTDPDGTPADMGARIWGGLPDCNANGVPDNYEWGTGDCDQNQVLDVCEASAANDCDGDGHLDSCEIASGVEQDCNGNGRADSCETDCNGNNRPDDCDIATGSSLDLNNDSIPDDCKPDCNNNNLPDFVEIQYGLLPDCNVNLVPDGCELASGAVSDCDGNNRPDSCDIAQAPVLDCDHNMVIDACEVAVRDCNGNSIVDACDIASGTSIDLNGDGHPDECKPDCNLNGVPDYLDIAFGVSLDCNTNTVPDECDIPLNAGLDCNGNTQIDLCEVANGVSPDCNHNQLPDSCDLASGASADCNGNQVPDSCDVAQAGADCDSDGQVDSCEIAAGAPDCDADGLMDECELSAGAADAYGISGASISCTGDGVPDSCQPAADCDVNGTPDWCEIAAGSTDAYGVSGASINCTGDGVPDSCQPVADCDADGTPNFCEIAAGSADIYGDGRGVITCAADGIPDSCQPALDCDQDGLPDVCELAAGAADTYGTTQFSISCSPDGIPDSCQLADDCDGDGTPDYCEIVAGAADSYGLLGISVSCKPDGVPDSCQPVTDCDSDGTPDVCELASGSGSDCNGNARLDNCDIAVGFSVDLNGNGIPDECECDSSNFCIPLPNSTGQPAQISLIGTPSLSLNNATLRCTQLPPTTSGLFFFGTGSLNPGNPFGNGRLCISGSIRRLPLTQAVAGVVNQAQNFGSTPYAGIQAGDVRFFQFWYRNTAAGGAGFNLSDGIRVTFCP